MNRQENRFESVARPDDEDEDDWLDTPDEEPVELLFKESFFPPTCAVCPRQMDMVVVVVAV